MRHWRGHDGAESLGQTHGIFGDKIELDGLDGDEAILLRIVSAKNRSQNAAADLVQDAIRAEGGRRTHARGVIKRQWTYSLRIKKS